MPYHIKNFKELNNLVNDLHHYAQTYWVLMKDFAPFLDMQEFLKWKITFYAKAGKNADNEFDRYKNGQLQKMSELFLRNLCL